jgi:hypothetical protein
MTTEEIFYSILCSIVASFIFIFLVLILFKPKIRISPFICKGKYMDGDDTDYYFIKLINISLFSAYDVSFELLEVDRYPTPNGQMNNRFRPLSLVLNHVSHIPGYRPSSLRKNAPYAVRIRTSEDINKILANDYKSVMVKVSLKHGLTGLVKVHSKEYTDSIQIKTGKFEYGLKFGSIN